MLGWVDFSEEERSRAHELMALAKTDGAIDELGLGVLRDGFADRLFPGSSTLHNHARYFFLDAYLMMDLEHQMAGKPYEEVWKAYENGEKETARKLLSWCDSHGRTGTGITGSTYVDGDSWVKQTRASMDWAAMAAYGILTDGNVKLGGFLRKISRSKSGQSDQFGADDDEDALGSSSGLWNVPGESRAGWRDDDEISLELQPSERKMLRGTICSKWRGGMYASMLSEAASLPRLREAARSDDGLSFVKLANAVLADASLLPGFGDWDVLKAAADFSALAAVLHIRFNYVLAHNVEGASNITACEDAWLAACSAGSPYWERACKCDITKAFELSGASAESAKGAATKRFLLDAQECILTGEIEKLDELIRRRERSLKTSSRAKTSHPSEYAGRWYGGTELLYRLDTVFVLAEEIIGEGVSSD